MSGCCRRKELTYLTLENITQLDGMTLVTIPYTKTYVERSFVIVGEFYNIFQRYLKLRPNDVSSNRLFLSRRNGNIVNIPVGINTVGAVPKTVATFLQLPEPEKYTSHSIRRTSATIYADAGATEAELMRLGKWKSPTVAKGYVDDSVANKKKVAHQITSAVTGVPGTPGSVASAGAVVTAEQASVVHVQQQPATITLPVSVIPEEPSTSKNFEFSADIVPTNNTEFDNVDSGYDSFDSILSEDSDSSLKSDKSYKSLSPLKHQSRSRRYSPNIRMNNSSLPDQAMSSEHLTHNIQPADTLEQQKYGKRRPPLTPISRQRTPSVDFQASHSKEQRPSGDSGVSAISHMQSNK